MMLRRVLILRVWPRYLNLGRASILDVFMVMLSSFVAFLPRCSKCTVLNYTICIYEYIKKKTAVHEAFQYLQNMLCKRIIEL